MMKRLTEHINCFVGCFIMLNHIRQYNRDTTYRSDKKLGLFFYPFLAFTIYSQKIHKGLTIALKKPHKDLIKVFKRPHSKYKIQSYHVVIAKGSDATK